MRYTQLDRIEAVDAGRAGRGVKVATRADETYSEHAVRHAVASGYPWSLALEGMFQLASLVLTAGEAEPALVFLLRIDEARFERPIPFGARLDFTLCVLGRNAELARVACDAAIDGVPAGSARFAVGFRPLTGPMIEGYRLHAGFVTEGWRRLAALGGDA
ncbi:MAG TPA: hypothetical protein VFD84_05440 [Candidatus Binatia bacterium]|jgi:3-hydroxyacyl-[acyl-carrier-protein] dehydratase|nr:hypothetical protein [Candidatus Binatia bacterium]